MVTFKVLEKDEVVNIYEEHLVNDFPPPEQKPLSVLTSLMKRGLYLAYGMFDEENLVAYAFFAKSVGYQDILIDYLAVCASYRNQGYGSQCLALMREELRGYDSIIFEVESGRSAKNEAELKTCQKRLDFYRKNSLKDTNLGVSLFGVDMLVLYLTVKQTPCEERIKVVLERIYDEFYGEGLHREKVTIHIQS